MNLLNYLKIKPKEIDCINCKFNQDHIVCIKLFKNYYKKSHNEKIREYN